MKSIDREFIRFVFFGVVNTGLTYVVYVVFLLILPYVVSYTLSYVLGIALAYYLNVRFVFQERAHWRTAIQYPLVYVVQYVLGVVLLYLLVEVFRISELIAPFVVILVTVPVTYLLSRLIIKGHWLSG